MAQTLNRKGIRINLFVQRVSKAPRLWVENHFSDRHGRPTFGQHFSKVHLSERLVSKRHLTNSHSAIRHLTNRHLVERFLAD